MKMFSPETRVVSCTPALLIDGNGEFNKAIERNLNLASESRPTVVVSIIGVQSTGKSTLANHLFGTGFEVMNQANGMAQTTKGIWMAKCPSPTSGSTVLVIDTEGSDGQEREEDVKFEKQTALFSLAISNTVIMNMKCDNVNLNHGGGRTLLRAVLEVMIRRFSTPRKVNLVFVLRDRNEVPLDKLKEQLEAGVQEMLREIIEHQEQSIAPLEDYFHIEVVKLPHYRLEKEDFATEVASLKEQIMCWTTSDELVVERIAASGFAHYAKNIWDDIKEDKDLDLPQQSIMIAQVRCKAIEEEKYQSFLKDESWRQIKDQVAVSGEVVLDFGKRVGSIRDIFLTQYDHDAQYYHSTQRDVYKERLAKKLLQEIEPTYCFLVERMYRGTVEKFFNAALEEINVETALNNLKTEDYMTEFHNKLQDAALNNANWNHAAKAIAMLKSMMDSVIARAALQVNQQFEQKKLKWKTFALSAVVGTTAGVCSFLGATAVVAYAPELAPLIAQNIVRFPVRELAPKLLAALCGTLGASTPPIIQGLKQNNAVIAKNLPHLMAFILKEALEVYKFDCCPSSSVA